MFGTRQRITQEEYGIGKGIWKGKRIESVKFEFPSSQF